MRKKKLLSRISELESEIARLKYNEEYWKDMIMRFAKGLHEHGVEAEIVFPRGPEIEVTELDGKPKYVYGMSTEPPELRFDFTDHDEKLKYKFDGVEADVIKIALRKQKAEEVGTRNGKTCCPMCGEPEFHQNYCDRCGQKLRGR